MEAEQNQFRPHIYRGLKKSIKVYDNIFYRRLELNAHRENSHKSVVIDFVFLEARKIY